MQKARKAADPIVEQHLLFEYPSIATGDSVEVYNFDFTKKLMNTTTIVKTVLPETNGLVFWMDYTFILDDDNVKTTNGLIKPSTVGSTPNWHPGHHQGVYFIPFDEIKTVSSLEVTIKPGEMDIDFEFKNC